MTHRPLRGQDASSCRRLIRYQGTRNPPQGDDALFMSLKIALHVSQNSPSWVSKFPLVGLKIAPYPRLIRAPIAHKSEEAHNRKFRAKRRKQQLTSSSRGEQTPIVTIQLFSANSPCRALLGVPVSLRCDPNAANLRRIV